MKSISIQSIQKTLLCAALLLVGTMAFAKRTPAGAGHASPAVYKEIVQFIDMEKGHKNDWFVHIEKFSKQKIHMLKKHFDECANLHRQKMVKIESDGCSSELFNTFLRDAIALHRKHCQAWRDMHEKNHQQCQAIADRHETELNTFEGGLE